MKRILSVVFIIMAILLGGCQGRSSNIPASTGRTADTQSDAPTAAPTDALYDAPTAAPTDALPDEPTAAPTDSLSDMPTAAPADALSGTPTAAPTDALSDEPTTAPTDSLSDTPTAAPTDIPTADSENQIIVSDAGALREALNSAKPGDNIVLRSGTYEGHFEWNVSGTDQQPITLSSYPGEHAVITIPKDTDGAAFSTNGCKHIKISDVSFIDLQAKAVYGILMTGGEADITVSGCEFANIKTTSPGTEDEASGEANAILLFGESKDAIHHITIENNIVHDNVNGWSENISVAGNCEYIFVNNNVVYDCTNIGIDFYGNAEYCSDPELDQPRNCRCIGNKVRNCNSFYAENAGIYVDGAYSILVEGNEVYGNCYGIEIGSEEWRKYYTDKKRVQDITVKDNNIHDNEECGLRIGGWTDDNSTGIVYNCDISGNYFKNNNTEILLAKCDTIRFKDNVFANGDTCKQAVEYDEEISESKITNIIFN